MIDQEICIVDLDHLGTIQPRELVRVGAGDEQLARLVFVHGFLESPPAYRRPLELLQEQPEARSLYVYHYRSPWVVEGIGHFDFALRDLGAGVAPGGDEATRALEDDRRRKTQPLLDLAGRIRAALREDRDKPGAGGRRGPGFGLTRQGPPEVAGGAWPGGYPPAGCLARWGGWPDRLNIVFMIHGIRDYGSWHPALGEALERRLARATGYWRIIAIEYGFFSALQFLVPIQQRRVVAGRDPADHGAGRPRARGLALVLRGRVGGRSRRRGGAPRRAHHPGHAQRSTPTRRRRAACSWPRAAGRSDHPRGGSR